MKLTLQLLRQRNSVYFVHQILNDAVTQNTANKLHWLVFKILYRAALNVYLWKHVS